MASGDDLFNLHLSLGRLRDWANAASLDYQTKHIIREEELSPEEKVIGTSLNQIVDNCEYILQDLEDDMDFFDASMKPDDISEDSISDYLRHMDDNYHTADLYFDNVYDPGLPQHGAFETIGEELSRLGRDYALSVLRKCNRN